jgi:hypothetical protein
MYKLALHLIAQFVPSHVAVAPEAVGQGESHRDPHELTLLLSWHASPHRWYPARQLKSHEAPLQEALPLLGVLHGVHEVPQLATSLSKTQLPLQLWVPEGQLPPQAFPAAMQVPLHNIVPPGHSAPHFVPSHVAVPPIGTGQGVQPVPQLATSVSFAQPAPHP